MSRTPPSSSVRQAFGVGEPVRLLAGGQGSSWVAGDVVFKPAGDALQEWLAVVLADIGGEGFRVAAPVRARDGAWIVQGWSATRWVPGVEPDYSSTSTWQQIIAAGRAFHHAIAHVDRPRFLDVRHDPWAQADRAAWGERQVSYLPEFSAVARRLQSALEPLGQAQVVHGDLAGNVLFAAGLPPAIIDISPYFRPPAYSEGIVVADALCWHEAPASLPETLGVSRAAVARGLLFRMATTNQRARSGDDGADLADEARRYHRATSAIGL